MSEELRLRTGSEGLSVRFEASKPHAYHSHLPLSDVPLKTLFFEEEVLYLSLRRNSCGEIFSVPGQRRRKSAEDVSSDTADEDRIY